jgi:hypothetical protein
MADEAGPCGRAKKQHYQLLGLIYCGEELG